MSKVQLHTLEEDTSKAVKPSDDGDDKLPLSMTSWSFLFYFTYPFFYASSFNDKLKLPFLFYLSFFLFYVILFTTGESSVCHKHQKKMNELGPGAKGPWGLLGGTPARKTKTKKKTKFLHVPFWLQSMAIILWSQNGTCKNSIGAIGPGAKVPWGPIHAVSVAHDEFYLANGQMAKGEGRRLTRRSAVWALCRETVELAHPPKPMLILLGTIFRSGFGSAAGKGTKRAFLYTQNRAWLEFFELLREVVFVNLGSEFFFWSK